MLKANKKTLILTSAITLLPMMIGLFLWKQLPDTMATHFGFSNEADGFSSKPFTVIGIPLFLLVMEWICAIITSNDPKKQNISPKVFTLVLWIVPVVSVFVAAIIYPYNLGYKFDMIFLRKCLWDCSSSSSAIIFQNPVRITLSASGFPGHWLMKKTGTEHIAWQVSSGYCVESSCLCAHYAESGIRS